MSDGAKSTCYHLQISDRSQREIGGKWVDAEAFICGFPDDEPSRFVNAPTWLLKLVGGGLLVHPERDCVSCPAFKSPSVAKSDDQN